MGLIDVGAGKFLEVRRIFARILPNVPEKKAKEKWPPKKLKKSLHVILGAIFFKSKHVQRHSFTYFQEILHVF